MNIWVLVIDTDEATRCSVATILNDAGYSAVTAGSGLEGLRLWEETQPELVIADTTLPGRDGIDVMMALRGSGAEVKILAMTGFHRHGNIDIAETLCRLGADDVLLKPLAPEVLLAKVDRLISLPPAQSAA
jgi:DNA-binding response OmpR family regulator